MRIPATLLSLLAGSLISAAAAAGPLVDLQVVSRSRAAPLPLHWQAGRAYVVGTPQERFSVRLSNRTGARVLVVLSVDGINVITGQTAQGSQSGYVLDPWESADITGWRKSTEDVARFYFTSLEDSYAGRTGRADQVGVIGVAAWREQAPAPAAALPPPSRVAPAAGADMAREGTRALPQEPLAQGAEAARRAPAAPAAESADAVRGNEGAVARRPYMEKRLGTGHGEREASHMSYTSFTRATVAPEQVSAIWYDAYERLASRGIVPRRAPCCQDPEPFPGGFVPDPRS